MAFVSSLVIHYPSSLPEVPVSVASSIASTSPATPVAKRGAIKPGVQSAEDFSKLPQRQPSYPPTMQLSVEAIVAIVALAATLPSNILLLWSICRRRQRRSDKNQVNEIGPSSISSRRFPLGSGLLRILVDNATDVDGPAGMGGLAGQSWGLSVNVQFRKLSGAP